MIETRIVPPRIHHLSSMLDIERESYSTPWTGLDFVDALRQPNTIGAVLEILEGPKLLRKLFEKPASRRAQTVAGYLMCYAKKSTYSIWNLAVAKDCRRMGCGTLLIEHLKERLQKGAKQRICIAIDERNLASQLFLRSCGFRWEETIRQPWALVSEVDVYMMVFRKVVMNNRFQQERIKHASDF